MAAAVSFLPMHACAQLLHQLLRRRGPGAGGCRRVRLVPQRRRRQREEAAVLFGVRMQKAASAGGRRSRQEHAAAGVPAQQRVQQGRRQGHRQRAGRGWPEAPQVQAPQGRALLVSQVLVRRCTMYETMFSTVISRQVKLGY
jgi:hypothetical protein